MDGYKIGEIAAFLGLSSEALRYYEKNGIIHSKRDEESGYRYFDAWDVNFLLDCSDYRSYELSVSTVRSILNDYSLEELAEAMHQQTFLLLERLNELQHKLDRTYRLTEQLRGIPDELGRFHITESPSIVFQPIRRNGELILDKERMDSYQFWNARRPFIHNTFVLPRKGHDNLFREYTWGYSVPYGELHSENKEKLTYAQYLPSYKAVYTVFAAHGENTFLKCFENQVVHPLLEQDFKIQPERVVGNLLARVHERNGFTRYCEVWMPVE